MTSETLSRSWDIQEQISTIRNESVGSSERAAQGRMEILLSNGCLAESIVTTLEENPNIEKEDLIHRVNLSERVTHPEVTQNFIEAIYQKKHQIQLRTETLGIKEKSEDEFAADLFHSLIRPEEPGVVPEYEIKGPIKVNLEYPMVIVLEVENKDDLDRLNLHASGGHMAVRSIYQSGQRIGDVPIIILDVNVTAAEKAQSLAHEKEHAVMDTFQRALYSTRQPIEGASEDLSNEINKLATVWGPTTTEEMFFGNLFKMESALYGNSSLEDVTNSKEYEDVLNFGLSRAKDEIIAYITGNTDPNFMALLLLSEDSSYNLYKHTLNLNPDLYKELWTDYYNSLRSYIPYAINLYKTYRENPITSFRNQSYKWVLAQIPIQQWQSQLHQMPFDAELESLNELIKENNQRYQRAKEDSPEALHQIEEELGRFYTELAQASYEGTMFRAVDKKRKEIITQ